MSSSREVQVACIQINSGPNVSENLAKIESFLVQAAESNAQLVLLPENFAQMPNAAKQRHIEPWLASDADAAQAPVQEFIWRMAQQLRLTLIAGSLAVQVEPDSKPMARCFVVDHNGELIGLYDKIHLFDVDTGSGDEQIRYCESDDFCAGSTDQLSKQLSKQLSNHQPSSIVDCSRGAHDIPINLGLSICYDVRFPEWYRSLQRAGAHMMSVPAAFTYETGKEHWQVLLRARAIENQCFVIAAGQCGEHAQASDPDKPRKTWGHSMIIDPWGKVMASLQGEEGLLISKIDLTSRDKIIARFPAVEHRRL